MKEAASFRTEQDMKAHIVREWAFEENNMFEEGDIVICGEPVDASCNRWQNTKNVCVKRMGAEDYMEKYGTPQCIGYYCEASESSGKLSVIYARPLDGYKLLVRFNTGESGVFDMEPLLGALAFGPLKDKTEFDRVYIDFGVLTWLDGSADLAPEYVYEHTEEEQKRA